MRGRQEVQPRLFFTIDVESRIRADHPLRDVKKRVDGILFGISELFDQAYPKFGRPGIPPEVLLKALLLQALYSIRREKQLLERIDTDLLFRWFLDLDPADEVFDATAYAHNRPRRHEHEIITVFFDAIVQQALSANLCSDHFSVDGTVIESYASKKVSSPERTAPNHRKILPTILGLQAATVMALNLVIRKSIFTAKSVRIKLTSAGRILNACCFAREKARLRHWLTWDTSFPKIATD